MLTDDDIDHCHHEAQKFARGAPQARFGGDGSPLITFDRHGENVEVSVTPSGDGPSPQLRFVTSTIDTSEEQLVWGN